MNFARPSVWTIWSRNSRHKALTPVLVCQHGHIAVRRSLPCFFGLQAMLHDTSCLLYAGPRPSAKSAMASRFSQSHGRPTTGVNFTQNLTRHGRDQAPLFTFCAHETHILGVGLALTPVLLCQHGHIAVRRSLPGFFGLQAMLHDTSCLLYAGPRSSAKSAMASWFSQSQGRRTTGVIFTRDLTRHGRDQAPLFVFCAQRKSYSRRRSSDWTKIRTRSGTEA